jgi:hypothetical protein
MVGVEPVHRIKRVIRRIDLHGIQWIARAVLVRRIEDVVIALVFCPKIVQRILEGREREVPGA